MRKTLFISRLAAFAMTLVMLISFTGVLPVSAATQSFDGYIYNGDFESGSAGGWNLSSTASFVAGGHDGSSYCMRFSGKAWANCNQTFTVKANTDYRLSGWVKRVSGSGAHHFYVQDLNGNKCTRLNNTQSWFSFIYDGWVQHVLDFNSGDNTTLRLYITIEDPDSVFLYDDMLIEELGPASSEGCVRNGDFELGSAGGWLINSASSFYQGGRNDSAYSLKFTGNPGVTARQSIRVKGMTDYRLTVYSKRSRGSGRNRVFVQRGDTVIESLNGSDGIIDDTVREWIEHVYEFNSGPATQITVFLQMLDSGATFLYDDITLEEIKGPDYSGVKKGDTTLDGVLDENDAELLRQHLAGEITLEDAAAYAADMDYSGAVTGEDLALLNTALDAENPVPVALYPINGETVAKGSWQVEALFEDYSPGVTDDYSGITSRKDQYARDPVVLRWIAPSGGARSYSIILADNSKMTGAKRYQIQNDNIPGEKSLSLQNLLVDTDYYWAVDFNGRVSELGTFHTAKTVRTLWIDGVSNTRDLGGILTEDGTMRVRYNVAFRGAKFDGITDAGRAAVADIGLKTDVDLRTKSEGVQAPLGSLATWFLAGDNGAAMYYTGDESSISNLTGNFVKATVNAIRVYADQSKFPAYFHCSYGRDRTGTMGFLLLGLLGVSRIDIQRDYEITFLSEFGGGGSAASGHLAKINATMDWVQQNYAVGGTLQESCEAYLRAAGLTTADINAIRANMLEPAEVEPVTVTGIALTALPTKLSYAEGKDALEPDGGVLTVSYSDGSSEEIALSADMISGFDNSAVGAQTLTVSYGGFTATFEIEIVAYDPLGDPDGDGEITVADALISLRLALKLAEETPELLAACDVDGDGEVTVSDALRILRAAAKLTASF